MRLHEENGEVRDAGDLLEEFQVRWGWVGELSAASNLDTVGARRITLALSQMWDDYRDMLRVVYPALGLNLDTLPSTMQPVAVDGRTHV
jgi:hypothetical protein